MGHLPHSAPPGGRLPSRTCSSSIVEDSGQGEPVVFVHGSWGDLHSWDALVAELPGTG